MSTIRYKSSKNMNFWNTNFQKSFKSNICKMIINLIKELCAASTSKQKELWRSEQNLFKCRFELENMVVVKQENTVELFTCFLLIKKYINFFGIPLYIMILY